MYEETLKIRKLQIKVQGKLNAQKTNIGERVAIWCKECLPELYSQVWMFVDGATHR
jgi:hypothetical protein